MPRNAPLRRFKTPQNAGISQSADAVGAGSAAVNLRILRKRENAPRGSKRQKRVLRFGGIPQNPEFLAFVRTLPCILNGLTGYAPLGTLQIKHFCLGRIEASHVGRSGMAQKAADETAIPMCVAAHRTGPFAFHKISREFFSTWGVNKQVVVEKTQAAARAVGISIHEGVVL